MKRSSLFAAAVTLVALLSIAPPALADGFIIPDPPPMPLPEPVWLTIRYHRVSVTIEDQVAITRVDQVFVNEHSWEIEGAYVFPLPVGATVSRFVMWVDGAPIEAEILPAEQARAIYEDIVRSRRDPALLEYVGRDAVRARIFPIPPGAERRVQLEYTEVLPVEDGLVRYVYPLDTERFSHRPLQDCAVRIEIDSPQPLRAVYSPTHQDRVLIERDGEYRAVISYEETDVLPDTNLELVYTVSPDDVGLNLLSYREPGDDGFFLLLVAPGIEVDPAQIVPRDVLLVLDTSGSMQGDKIVQARDALVYILQRLNPEDRFNVIAFSSGVRQYADGLHSTAEAGQAATWVERLEAVGGTDINRALLEALAQVDPERSAVVILLTDGQPTEGVTDVDQILANAAGAAPANARVFTFGVGDDVNTTLLDALAEQHAGSSAYIRPHERIDERVSAFYARVSTPVLSDVTLEVSGVTVEELYPDPLPGLFAGSQLIVTGRYRAGGPARIVLSGQVNGVRREFVYEASFRPSGGDEFIPRLWAARKIGYLLTQIRLRGERQEWVEAVVALSVRFGIITPYTSFLIQEDLWTDAGQEEAVERFLALPTPPAFGAPAVDQAAGEADLRGAESPLDGMMPAEVAQVVRYVGSRTFFLRDGVWIDASFDADRMEPVAVGFATQSYFDLLAARPEWGAFLALGERVIFVGDGVAYAVVEGDPGPVQLPPIDTPDPTPAATPNPQPEAVDAPGGGLCLGAGVMIAIGLALAAVWQRMRL